jgi:hypothetical protein
MIIGRVAIIPFLEGKLDGNGQLTEPDIDAIFKKWLDRHPEFQEKKFHVIRAKSYQVDDDLETILVRVTADVDDEISAYDPAEDADLYEKFLVAKSDSPRSEPQKIWIEQCDAVENIEAEYGTEKAIGYLIGEKLLSFLEAADARSEWRAEIPHFVTRIKTIFEPWQIAQFFEIPRRLGTFGHITDDEGHNFWRKQRDDSENISEDSRNLLLFERAREWLMEEPS